MYLERAVAAHYSELSQNRTILLGMAYAMQADLNIVKGDVEAIRSDLTLFKGEVNRRFNGVDQQLDNMEQRFEQRFTSIEGKLEQVLQLLTNRS